jgi:hypothetical protein
MRPIPHPKPSEEAVEQVAERAQMFMLRRGYEDAVRSACESALGDVKQWPGVSVRDEEAVLAEAEETVRDTLPESFEYSVIDDSEYGPGIAVETGCTECGNRNVFNGQLEFPSAQFVSYEVDDGTDRCFIDDGGATVVAISCGTCGEALKTIFLSRAGNARSMSPR